MEAWDATVLGRAWGVVEGIGGRRGRGRRPASPSKLELARLRTRGEGDGVIEK